MEKKNTEKSLYARLFGRSIFSIFFGKFFEIKNNAAGIIAIVLVFTLSYILIQNAEHFKESSSELAEGLINIIFVVVGYYFGAKQNAISKESDGA